MMRTLPWMVLGSVAVLMAALVWSFFEHVYFEETLFFVMTAEWG